MHTNAANAHAYPFLFSLGLEFYSPSLTPKGSERIYFYDPQQERPKKTRDGSNCPIRFPTCAWLEGTDGQERIDWLEVRWKAETRVDIQGLAIVVYLSGRKGGVVWGSGSGSLPVC